MLDTAPLSAARKVWISVNATHGVSHDAQRQPALTCAGGREQGRGRPRRLPDLHEGTPRCAESACPRASRSVRQARGDRGRSSLSPAVRLRWPPPGEHAAVGGLASLLASPDSAPAAGCGASAPPIEIRSLTFRHARERIAIAVFPHLLTDGVSQGF